MAGTKRSRLVVLLIGLTCLCVAPGLAQLTDRTQNPNVANVGIAKSLQQQAGTGTGDVMTPDSSMFIITRDPFRSIRRGRQLFQRKFLRSQGQGPLANDGVGEIGDATKNLGAGLADSCAGCHGQPRGSAGVGGHVITRPNSRDAPHLFGVGLKEMLADEITTELRAIRTSAVNAARSTGRNQTRDLRTSESHGEVQYGSITARPDGAVDTSQVRGVDADLRVRPFFRHGGTISIREFIVGAFSDEMGLKAVDPGLLAASRGGVFVTPSGMVLDGSKDRLESPRVADRFEDGDGDGVVNEIPTSLVDHMEFYLLNYFKPGTYEQTPSVQAGKPVLTQIGCTACHIPQMNVIRDRRVADVETVFDPVRGNPFNRLFATATPKHGTANDGTGFPTLKLPNGGSFTVQDLFSDFKRHDLGPNFHERNFDGTMQTQFMTPPLWGVGSTAPFGHDGRSMTLTEAILRHGGEALTSRNSFVALAAPQKQQLLDFLNSLILFPPDDTASNLEPADPTNPNYPQVGGGSIRLVTIFNNPNDPE